MTETARVDIEDTHTLGPQRDTLARTDILDPGHHRLAAGLLALARLFRDRLAAVWTPPRRRGGRLAAVPAALPFPRETVVVVDDPRAGEDFLIHLLGRDVDVPLPHLRIERPLDTVLYLLFVVPLAPHPRDSGVPEVVRVHRLVDASTVGDRFQEALEAGWRQRAVVFGDRGTLVKRVETGRLGFVRAWVGVVQVHPQRRLGVDDRIRLDGRPLEADGVAIRRVRRSVVFKVDVLDAQRPGEGQPRAGIGQELDERLVARPGGRLGQRRDLVLREHVRLVNGLGLWVRLVRVEGVDPLRVAMVAPAGERRLVVVDRRVAGWPAAADRRVPPQLEEQLADTLDVLVDEPAVAALGEDPQPVGVLSERGDREVAVTGPDPRPDGLVVVGVDVGVGKPLKCVLVAPTEPAEVVGRHRAVKSVRFHKTMVRKTPAFCSNHGVKTGREQRAGEDSSTVERALHQPAACREVAA